MTFPVASFNNLPSERVQRSFDTYTWLFKEAASLSWEDARLRSAAWGEAIQQHSPELLAELQIYATGAQAAGVNISGRPVDVVDFVALNSRSEILASVWSTPNECTTLQYTSPNRSIIGQTWDWFGVQRDALVLQHSANSEGTFYLSITEAGMLAKIGANEHGLCVGLNFLSSASGPAIPSAENNWVLPVHVLLRLILDRCTSVKEASDLLTEIRPSGAANITLADRFGNTAMLECMPAQTPVAVTETVPGWRLHTNHCVNEGTATLQGSMGGAFDETFDRYVRAAELIGAFTGADPVLNIKSVLEDTENGFHAICQSPNPALQKSDCTETVLAALWSTGQGMEFPELLLAPGRPNEVAWQDPVLVKRANFS